MLQNKQPDLSHLINLCVAAYGLQVQNFVQAVPGEHVMATAYPFVKPKTAEQRAQVAEPNVGIGAPAEDSLQQS